jgi:hypothetical protein
LNTLFFSLLTAIISTLILKRTQLQLVDPGRPELTGIQSHSKFFLPACPEWTLIKNKFAISLLAFYHGFLRKAKG